MTDEMSRVIDSIALPYGTKFPIKPKTGWSFNGIEGYWMPEEAGPDILQEVLDLVYGKALADLDAGDPCAFYPRKYPPDHDGLFAGLLFRLRELFYDGLHGLGPVGEIRRKCG